MHCHEVQTNLDRYLRQELTGPPLEQVEAHLNACAECREHLARLQRFAALLAEAVPVPPLPEGFRAKVLAAAREREALRPAPRSVAEPRVRRLAAWLVKRAAQAAALAAGLLIGMVMAEQTWRSASRQAPVPSDPAAIYELDSLAAAPGDSLVQSYLALTKSPDPNGA